MNQCACADYRFILLGVPDVHGALRGKVFTREEFHLVAERGRSTLSDLVLAVDAADQPITSLSEVGLNAGAPDLFVRPELDTLAAMSWRRGWGICLGTALWADGTECELSPRAVLASVLGTTALSERAIRAAFEYEVRIYDAETGRPVTSGPQYSLVEAARLFSLVEDLDRACRQLNLDLRVVHTEAGPGLLEVNLAPSDGLRAADDAMLLKTCLKQLAASRGLRASFLAKPVVGEEGSGGHLHLSLWDAQGNNVFAADPEGLYGMSSEMAASLAGLLHHMAALCLLFNPTINSYKRVVPGCFAPVNASWGTDNRSTAVRAIMSTPSSTRLEIRRPGADANPYLVLAGALAAVASGLTAKTTLPGPVEGDASAPDRSAAASLASSLEAALTDFKEDSRLLEFLGKRFSSYYQATRRWELDAWQRAVSDWELERYGPIA